MEENFERSIRLSKAAKELNIGKDTIIEFLSTKGFQVDPSPNTKLTAEMYGLLVKEFQGDKEVKNESMKLGNFSYYGGSFADDSALSSQESLDEYGYDDLIIRTNTIITPVRKDNEPKTSEPEDFSRKFHRVSFTNVADGSTDVYLAFKEDFESKWAGNPDNPFPFKKAISLLTQPERTCYFQKQQKDEKNGKERHKIFVPINDESALELRVALNVNRIDTFTNKFYYFVGKCRIVPFFQAPKKDTYTAVCSFHVLKPGERGGTNSQQFIDLVQSIEAMEVAKTDLNKDKDREIWKNYVIALKQLVREKEQIWKIKKISKPYTETINNSDDRATFVDIYISEKELANQFEKEILGYFNPNEIEDYGVSEDDAFIEFNSFREMSESEKEKLSELICEYFYEISPTSPIHTLSGEIDFKYSDEDSRDEVFSEIEDVLASEYQIELNIAGDGKIEIPPHNLVHLKKVIDDRFSSVVDLKKDSSTRLKVSFPQSGSTINPRDVDAILQGLNLNLAKTRFSKDMKSVDIEVAAFLRWDAFAELELKNTATITRFGNGSEITKEVEGTYIDGRYYCVDRRLNQQESEELLRRIQDVNEDLFFKRKATIYRFTLSESIDLESQRDFKTATDTPGECNYNISSSTLTIWADNEDDYYSILDRVQDAYPEAEIEEKSYSPSYYIVFRANQLDLRKNIVLRIQNDLRRENINLDDFDSIRNYSRNLFSYNFNTEDERDNFKLVLKQVCSTYKDLVTFSFDNPEGGTTYEFVKNEQLEQDNEKKVANDVRKASFVYLSPKEYEKLKEAKDQWGIDYSFRDGTMIGTLVQKFKDRLKFRITDDFDDMLNEGSGTVSYLKEGYITPIFNGELANINRMIRAMRKVTEPGTKAGYPTNKNLPNFLFDPTTARIPIADLDEEKAKILSNLNEPLLRNQPKQLEAVAKAMLAKDIAIIQGPPGTGKTTVIAEIIWQTLLEDPDSKILITSQTNLAVDNALERLKGKKLVRPIRIGNIEKFEDEGKAYSDKRLREWQDARPNSEEENKASDNAIAHWLISIGTNCDNSEEYAGIVEKWKKGLSEHSFLIKSRFSNEYMKNVNVFAATCSECGSRNFSEAYQLMFRKNSEVKSDPEFDLVIMDEASKATPPELVLPLTLGKKVVVIGDHKQLPPMIDENEFSEALEAVGAKKLVEDWTRADYKISQFEKLFVNSPKDFVASLDTQFRMHKQIMDCISQFYKDQAELEHGLICGIESEMDDPHFETRASRWHGLSLPPFITPNVHTIWVNVSTPEQKVGTSYKNEGEIEAIKEVLRVLCKASGFSEYKDFFKKEEDKEIGIITYYMPQMMKIREAIYPQFKRNDWRNFDQHKYENEYQLPFRINTVDRFQGMERNIVIVSTVRSDRQIGLDGKLHKNDHYPQALGFARELQRVNVGFSRAKRLLIVIGNEKHFANKQEYAEAIGNMYRIDITQLKNL